METKCLLKNLKSIPSTRVGFEQLEKDSQEVATRAKALGSKFVMCAWIPHDGDFKLDNAKKAVEVFNAAGKVFKENGLMFCYHPHGYEFFPYEKGTLLDYIITNTNPDYVSFEMDILWTQLVAAIPFRFLKNTESAGS